MENESGGGSGSGGGNHRDDDPHRKKTRYHRHTAHQIQRLESVFKDCPHPDEKQRLTLGRELSLHPRQIKFWFQNRRTQMKAQHERADNFALRSENDKIRCENIAIREALKNVICPSCGGPPVEDSYFDEHKLRMENSQLREELERVSNIAAKYIGRPISQLPPAQFNHIASLDLSIASLSTGPSLDLDHVQGSSSNLPFQQLYFSDMDKSMMKDMAGHALEELLQLLQNNETLWMKSGNDDKEILNLDSYETMFPRPNSHLKNPNIRLEGSRSSGVVIINGLTLVDMFMDCNKWVDIFPTIVSAAKTISVISPGVGGSSSGGHSLSGSLQLMYEEVQVLSPLVPTREFCILRYCHQIEQGSWAVVNISYDLPQFVSQCQSRRLPSGCLIQDMPNGYCQVTWVEVVEVVDQVPSHRLYTDLLHSGLAFGADRWLTTLQRMCQRFACLVVSSSTTRDLGGVIASAEGKRSMMKLAQRMVNNFCMSVSTSNSHRGTTLSGLNDAGIRVTAHKSNEPGHPNGLIISAATTFWLPVSPQTVFDFLKDERTRPQWDVLSNGNAVQEVAHIANGPHPGNCISVLRALNNTPNNMLILQESCIDSSGSMVVYSPVDSPAINIASNGGDPSYIPLLPSGFTITTDGQRDQGASSSKAHSGSGVGGSLVTVAFQILVNRLPTAKLNMESVATVNNLIGSTVQQIKSALNCPTQS